MSNARRVRLGTRASLFLAAAVLTAAAGGSVAPASATPAASAPTAAAAGPSIALLTGFGDAKFGSTIEEARKALPAMEPLSHDIKMPSAHFSSPHLERFVLRKHVVAGLASPVDVELRFWEGKLWAFLVYFEKTDLDAALKLLEKTYGPRTTGTEVQPIWRGEKATLQAMGKAGWYGATDNAISEKAREWFFAELKRNPGAVLTPSAATTPAPAASAPPK